MKGRCAAWAGPESLRESSGVAWCSKRCSQDSKLRPANKKAILRFQSWKGFRGFRVLDFRAQGVGWRASAEGPNP